MLELAESPKLEFLNLSWKGKLNLLMFYAVHGVCVAAFFTNFNSSLAMLAAVSFLIRMFGITGGYHRYFSHRTYKVNRVMQFIMAWIGCSAAQKGPLWWAAHHRAHHQNADGPKDIHSPMQEGFFWSHLGWWLSDKYDDTDWKKIPDLAQYPELVWMNKNFLIPPLFWALGCYFWAGADGVLWGFFVSTTFLWHATFLINSAAHLFGRRRYNTADTSRNSFILALLTLGEGWHNNHHHYQASVRQGFFWWEVDITFYLLKTLSFFGLTSDLRRVPKDITKPLSPHQ